MFTKFVITQHYTTYEHRVRTFPHFVVKRVIGISTAPGDNRRIAASRCLNVAKQIGQHEAEHFLVFSRMLQQCFQQPFARGDNSALARRSRNAGSATSTVSDFSKIPKYRRHSFYFSQTSRFIQFIWFLLKFLQCLPMLRCSNFVNPSP